MTSGPWVMRVFVFALLLVLCAQGADQRATLFVQGYVNSLEFFDKGPCEADLSAVAAPLDVAFTHLAQADVDAAAAQKGLVDLARALVLVSQGLGRCGKEDAAKQTKHAVVALVHPKLGSAHVVGAGYSEEHDEAWVNGHKVTGGDNHHKSNENREEVTLDVNGHDVRDSLVEAARLWSKGQYEEAGTTVGDMVKEISAFDEGFGSFFGGEDNFFKDGF